MGRLDGKTAIITGGASGIGAASVRRFVAEGARVLAADVQDEMGESLVKELGTAALYQHADVTREEQVNGLVERATGEWGRLDCMFNNAGIAGVMGEPEEISIEDFDATVAVLLRGVFLGIKHALPVMKRQASGSIINTASVAGLQGGMGPHVYSACKAAVIQLSRTVGVEFGPAGVRVNAICPGGIVTPIITDAVTALGGGGGGPEVVAAITQAMGGMQPLRRAGQPEDIAGAALWLASDESAFVTAQALVVDGGLTGGRQPGSGSLEEILSEDG